jgi:peptidoglycan/LPS O-acetylase OafA/YrhL
MPVRASWSGGLNRIDRLTSVRGFAALYVFLYHCQNSLQSLTLHWFTGFAGKGYLAVDFFFVLSGFILSHVYLRAADEHRFRAGRFLALRLGRIYPAHAATLLLALLVTLLPRFDERRWLDYDLPTFFSNLLLVHSWGLHRNLSWNFVSWSISTEWFAYLMFPLFAWASLVVRERARRACLLAAAVLGVTALAIGWLHVHAMPPDLPAPHTALQFLRAQSPEPFGVAADFGLVRVSGEFLVGMLLYRAFDVWQRQPPRWAGAAAVLTTVLLAGVLYKHWAGLQLLQDIAAVALIATLIVLLALDRSPVSALLEARPLVYLGEISYSLYMVHGVGFLLYFAALDARWIHKPASAAQAWGFAAMLLAFAAGGGALSYRWVETPARERLKLWLDGRASARQAVAQVATQPQR